MTASIASHNFWMLLIISHLLPKLFWLTYVGHVLILTSFASHIKRSVKVLRNVDITLISSNITLILNRVSSDDTFSLSITSITYYNLRDSQTRCNTPLSTYFKYKSL